MQIVAGFVLFLEAYLALGVLFALVFAFRWVERIDPAARTGTHGFRLLILPGAAALWPLLACRLLRASDRVPRSHSQESP